MRKVFLFAVNVVCATAMIIPSATTAQTVGEVYASDAAVKGSVRETALGLEVGNGSVITAGQRSASLRLARGGQVRICPGTNLTINTSPTGKELMLAMSGGSLEAEYPLPATADAVLTPDFRILISGPANVNLSITANERGDACVRSRGEESYVVVSELMGNDFYRVKPNEQVVFHAGQAKNPQVNGDMTCGCPGPAPVQTAEAVPPAAMPTPMIGTAPSEVPIPAVTPAPPPIQQAHTPAQAPPTAAQQQAGLAALSNEAAVGAAANASAVFPAPPRTGQMQIQVDAPMIYNASGAPPDLTATLSRVHVEQLPWPDVPVVAAQPPAVAAAVAAQPAPASPPQPKKSFFRKVGGFFASIFK
jgi:hypothetical protein